MRTADVVIIFLLVALVAMTADGLWTASQRADNERRAAEQSAMRIAWQTATRLTEMRSFISSSGKEPKLSEPFTAREIWIKAFQPSDVRWSDKPAKYGRGLRLQTVIAFHDQLPSYRFEAALTRLSPAQLQAAFEGQWHALHAVCIVSLLESGETVIDSCDFTKGEKPDYPFHKISGD